MRKPDLMNSHEFPTPERPDSSTPAARVSPETSWLLINRFETPKTSSGRIDSLARSLTKT